MAREPLEFFIEVRREGVRLESAPASLAPCFEDALFRGVLEGRIPNDGRMPTFDVSPQWKDSQPPIVAGLSLLQEGVPAKSYDRQVFAAQAGDLIAGLVDAKQLSHGQSAEWEVVARPPPRAATRCFSTRVHRKPYPFQETSLPDVPRGLLDVEIGAEVLDAIRQHVLSSGAVECAGLLVGHLRRDPQRGACKLEVVGTVEVSAGAGGASGHHFAFGVDSFISARRAAENRSDGAITVGWMHSHPACAACPKNPSCGMQTVFFSHRDVVVHSSGFPSAYMLALVVGKVSERPATEPGFRLYGWDAGRVAERSYRVTGREKAA
jgi:proteasome lid subunit RPN8/RPN11